MEKKKRNENGASDHNQLLTADDLLDSCGSPLRVEIPELPRNGKPGVVFIKRPSAGDMISFRVDFKKKQEQEEMEMEVEGNEQNEIEPEAREVTSKGNDEMSAMIGLLVISEDGKPVFSPEQVERIKDVRYDVWQHLASAVNSVIRTDEEVNPETGETINPFEEKADMN